MKAALCDGTLAKDIMYQTVVLIPKGASRNFRGIVMVELLWKTVTSLMNFRLTPAINFHDVLHGFRAGRRKGTADLEAKLPQHLTAMREAALFKIFLDLRKAYNALDRERALELLASYRVGPRTVRLLRTYWDRLTMVA